MSGIFCVCCNQHKMANTSGVEEYTTKWLKSAMVLKLKDPILLQYSYTD